jgi:hypothetical protein
MRFNIVKKAIVISILLVANISFSQEKLLDYFINKKGDTIYGIVRDNLNVGIYDYISSHPNSPSIHKYTFKLVEDNKDINKKRLYIEHNLKKAKCFKYKGKIFKYEKMVFEDGIYSVEEKKDTTFISIRYNDFLYKTNRLTDYVVLKSGDTIYQNISIPNIGKPFINVRGKKIKIDEDEINGYRYKNEIFELKLKPAIDLVDGNENFIRLLIKDKVTLYDYILTKNKIFNSYNDATYESQFMQFKYFFLEKNGELLYLNPTKFSIEAKEVFSDCPEIIEKLTKGYYVYEDLYSMVILYNYYLKHK